MQLQITTDYAIRVIGYLVLCDGKLANAKDISEQMGITYQYFLKISARLKEAGLILTEQGRNGGYRLAKDAEDITLYDIVKTMEGEIYFNRCLEPDGFCSRYATDTCPVHNIFVDLQTDIITSLKSKKMSDIWKP